MNEINFYNFSFQTLLTIHEYKMNSLEDNVVNKKITRRQQKFFAHHKILKKTY